MSRTRSRRDGPDRTLAASVCPQCGAEFVEGVGECSDCGVSLVAPRAPAERLTSPDGLVPVGTSFDPPFGRALAQAFDRAGIAHYFEALPYEAEGEFGPVMVHRVGAYVRPDDEEAATRLFSALDAAPWRDTSEVVAAATREPNEEATPEPTGHEGSPSLRDLAISDLDLPAAPSRNTGVGFAHHAAGFALWWLCLWGFFDGRLLLGVSSAIVAIVLHVRGERIGKAWRAEWEARAEAERRELEARDWDAVEAENRRKLDEAERVMRGEADPEDVDWLRDA